MVIIKYRGELETPSPVVVYPSIVGLVYANVRMPASIPKD